MLLPASVRDLKAQMDALARSEAATLERLRRQAAQLRGQLARIQPRPATSVSLVGADGGNNKVQFDPLSVDMVRVVDSSEREHHLEIVTKSVPLDELNARQFETTGEPRTALGHMMRHLGASSLSDVCRVFAEDPSKPRSSSWTGEYRGLHEWAVLFQLVRATFGTDTLIVRDGPFREKMFRPGYFTKYRQGLAAALEDQLRRNRRHLYLVGIQKKSRIFQKYRLAFALEGTFQTRYPCYVKIPKSMMEEAFKYDEWIENADGREDFVGGELFAVKFGSSPYDPVWLVDIFEPQAVDAPKIMGYLLNDAIGGFPVPCYPACVQRAHDAAALVDFDMDVIERIVSQALRGTLGEKADVLDKMAVQGGDPSAARYE